MYFLMLTLEKDNLGKDRRAAHAHDDGEIIFFPTIEDATQEGTRIAEENQRPVSIFTLPANHGSDKGKQS